MLHFAVFFYRIGPYHNARLRALAQHARVTAVEYSTEDAVYAWDKVVGDGDFERLTLFVDEAIEVQSSARVFARVQETLVRVRPDVVALPGWNSRAGLAALRWCRKHGVPAVIMSETTSWDYERSRFKEAVKSYILRQFAAGCVGGTSHRDYLVDLGMDAAQVFLGYDAVDNQYFADATAALRRSPEADAVRRKHNLPEKYFLASARFVRKKNLARILHAFAEYRRMVPEEGAWDLVILGDGPLRDHLQALCHNLGLGNHVRFPGFKQYDDLPTYYAFAGAFIHASTTEQWGLVVNEAMASGLPVLVSDRCGCAADLVKPGENGFTFPPGDSAMLAQLMQRLAGAQDLEAMGRNSRQTIARFDVTAFANGMLSAATAARRQEGRAGFFPYSPWLSGLLRWFRADGDVAAEDSASRRQKWLLFETSARPILAIPARPHRLHAVGLERFKTNTWRREMFRLAAETVLKFGSGRLLARAVSETELTKVGVDLSRWAQLLADYLNVDRVDLIAIWPSQAERRRLYLHVFDRGQKPIAFVKLALRREDRVRIQRSVAASSRIETRAEQGWKVPRCHFTGVLDEHFFSVEEPLPVGAQPPRWKESYDPTPLFAEWCGAVRRLPRDQICGTSWWSEFATTRPAEPLLFDRELAAGLAAGADVCRVHGDMSLANVVDHDRRLWLFDWECFHEAGPVLTDAVGFALSFTVGKAHAAPALHAARFGERFLADADARRRLDVMLALAYRHACGFPDAIIYIDEWSRMPSGAMR